MSDSYIEILIKRKTSPMKRFITYALMIVAAICLFFGLIGYLTLMLVGIILALAAYFSRLNSYVEFEYLYLSNELSIDRILAKSKRKRMAVLNLQRMEVLAPANSHRLDSYRNKRCKAYDYASGQEDSRPYVLIYSGEDEMSKVKLDMPEELFKAIRDVAPRKVFTD